MPNNSRIHVLCESIPFISVSRNILYLPNFRFYRILNVTLNRTSKEDDLSAIFQTDFYVFICKFYFKKNNLKLNNCFNSAGNKKYEKAAYSVSD